MYHGIYGHSRTDLWLDLVGCPEAEEDDKLLPGRGDLLLRLHALHQAVGPLHHPRSADTQQHVSRVTCTSRMLDTWPAARLPCRPRLPPQPDLDVEQRVGDVEPRVEQRDVVTARRLVQGNL